MHQILNIVFFFLHILQEHVFFFPRHQAIEASRSANYAYTLAANVCRNIHGLCAHSLLLYATRTLVVVLAPHEDAAPVGEVVGDDGQPVAPGLHHRLHVVQAGVAAQVGRLQAQVDLSRLLEFDDLLCRLPESEEDRERLIKERREKDREGGKGRQKERERDKLFSFF